MYSSKFLISAADGVATRIRTGARRMVGGADVNEDDQRSAAHRIGLGQHVVHVGRVGGAVYGEPA